MPPATSPPRCYLRYIEMIALQELGEHRAAVTAAQALLHDPGRRTEPAWRAKALAVVAEASNHLGEHSVSIAAMAEADWLLQDVPPDSYGHLSASMAVALAMRSAHLVEQSEAALAAITRHHDPAIQLLVVAGGGAAERLLGDRPAHPGARGRGRGAPRADRQQGDLDAAARAGARPSRRWRPAPASSRRTR